MHTNNTYGDTCKTKKHMNDIHINQDQTNIKHCIKEAANEVLGKQKKFRKWNGPQTMVNEEIENAPKENLKAYIPTVQNYL